MSDLNKQPKSSDFTVVSIWKRIPVVIQAIIIGYVVFQMGVVAWVMIVAPLVPAPWSILVMSGLLWLYWKYFSGNWWPETTAEARRKSFRDVKLSASVWKWGLVAASFFVVIVQSDFESVPVNQRYFVPHRQVTQTISRYIVSNALS